MRSCTVSSIANQESAYRTLEAKAASLLEKPVPSGWTPTHISKSTYLDISERIVRAAAVWQNQQGAIIDPHLKKEWGQTTSRFASSAALLLSFGRIPELSENAFKSMDWCCDQLPLGKMDSADFQMRELVTAFNILHKVADKNRSLRWRSGLKAVDPEKIYRSVSPDGSKLGTLNNWTVYAAAGEAMREDAGLSGNTGTICGYKFVDKYLPSQIDHLTEFGMYRDPGDPLTYDMATRIQFTILMRTQYRSLENDRLEPLLRRGNLTTLFYTSPNGSAPFGGRSAEFIFKEAMICFLCEWEARQRSQEGDHRFAGAFKRQARLCAQSILPWIMEMKPFRNSRNEFPPEEGWGNDPYGYYSVYSLLISSVLGLTAQLADESIDESFAPSESGTYTLELNEAFHKVFACNGQYFLEIDTKADFYYEATGLGRLEKKGIHPILALASSFTDHPKYKLPANAIPKHKIAFGVSWRSGDAWTSLASLSHELKTKLVVDEEIDQKLVFRVLYNISESNDEIEETYSMSADSVEISWKVVLQHPNKLSATRLIIPLLISNGTTRSSIREEKGHVTLEMEKFIYEIQFDPLLKYEINSESYGNRNGLYRSLHLDSKDNQISVRLSLGSVKS